MQCFVSSALLRSGKRWQLCTVMQGAMPVIVVGDVEPLPVLAHEAVRVVYPAPRSFAALLLEDALVRPGLQSSGMTARLQCVETPSMQCSALRKGPSMTSRNRSKPGWLGQSEGDAPAAPNRGIASCRLTLRSARATRSRHTRQPAPRIARLRSVAGRPSLPVMRMTIGLIGRNPLPLSVGRLKKQPSPM